MTRILFVCHGNICRSPMAEFIMKDLVERGGVEKQFHIASAATSTEEIGNPVYPQARRKLAEHGAGCAGKTSRQLTRADYRRYDLLIGMDRANIRNMRRICGGDPEKKIHLLMEFAARPPKGSPRKPSEAGCVGRGEARERPQFSPQSETEESGLCFDYIRRAPVRPAKSRTHGRPSASWRHMRSKG